MKDQEIDSLNAIVIYYDKHIRNLKGQQAILERDHSLNAKRSNPIITGDTITETPSQLLQQSSSKI